jgi:hypothetical protein
MEHLLAVPAARTRVHVVRQHRHDALVDDLWLNEAFAEFASNWAAVRARSYTDA